MVPNRTSDDLKTRLARVADFEAGTRRTILTRFFSRVGRTRAFAAIYKRIGPITDPWLLKRTDGRISTRLFGLPALMLATTGAKSGARRNSPLLYTRDGDDFLVIGTNFGQMNHPAWTYNLLADASAEVEVGGETVEVDGEAVEGGEWNRLWPKFVEMYPPYSSYLDRCGDRIPRMFLLHPVDREATGSES